MKIELRDDNFIVFLFTNDIKKICINNKVDLEDYLKKIFMKLEKVYNIDMYGNYDVEIFKDSNYGIVLSIKKNSDCYVDYYDSDLEMDICISKYVGFAYKLKGHINKKILKKCDIYKYKDGFYLYPKKISFIDLGYIIENCKIIFGEDVNKIISDGYKVSNLLHIY